MNPLVTGLFGATAGAASVFGNTPLDVIKTRMQVRIRLSCWSLQCCHLQTLLGNNIVFLFLVKGLEAHKYKSTLDCGVKILRHEGVAA